jgi:hypothetical protein
MPRWHDLRVPFFSARDGGTDMMTSQLASSTELCPRKVSRSKQRVCNAVRPALVDEELHITDDLEQ